MFSSSSVAHSATSTVAADRIVIKPSTEERIDDRPKSMTQFGSEQIKQAVIRGSDLPSLLDSVAGTRVLDLGGPLQSKRLQIRGGSPSQSVIVLDGIPLRTPFATGLDLGMYSLETLEQIELVRGGSSSEWGNGAISGVLKARTRSSENGSNAELGLKYGSLNRTELDAIITPGPFLIAGAFRQTDGRFPFVSALPGLPEQNKIRENNDVRFGRLMLRYDDEYRLGRLTSSFAFAAKEAGVPGFETQANLRARELRGNANARLMWQAKAYSLGLLGSGLSIDYTDPDEQASSNSVSRFVTFGADAHYRFLLSGHMFRAELTALNSYSQSTEHGNVSRQDVTLRASDEFMLGDWNMSLNTLANFLSDFGIDLMPSLGASVLITEDLQFRSSFGRSFRAPALDELYHPPQRGFSGNPGLEPESAWELDFGLKWVWMPAQTFDLSIYARRLDDTILYLNRNAFEVRPENVGLATALGLELESRNQYLTEHVNLGLAVSGALSWSQLDVTQEVIPTQPIWSASTELSLGIPKDGRKLIEVFTRSRLVSSTTANLQSTLFVPWYFRADAGITYSIFRGVFLSVSVTNIFDHQSLLTVNKLPLPGRLFLASIRVSDLSQN